MGPTIDQMMISQFLPWIWAFLGGDPSTGEPGKYINPKLRLEPDGLRGRKNAMIDLVDGPGAGSRCYVASYAQGTARIGGASIHIAGLDEPPPQTRWSEVRARVVDQDGSIRIGFTPTLESPDMAYLREIVEAAGPFRWGHHNFHLTSENTHIEGHPFARIQQQVIDEFSQDLLEIERRMRIEGWWEPQVEGAIMHRFDRGANVVAFGLGDVARIARDAVVMVGLDHGLQAGKQRAMLALASDVHSLDPRVWWVDESVSSGETTTREDARAVLDMLARHGLTVWDVDVWVGDRSAVGTRTIAARKSNGLLRKEMHALLKREARERGAVPPKLDAMPAIHTPKKYRGSVWDGARQLNDIMGTVTDGVPHGIVHPRCEEFIAACEQWDGGPKHPHKDIWDAGRYPVERACRRKRHGGGLVAARAVR